MKRTFAILALGIAVAALASVSPLTWKSTTLELGKVKVNETVNLTFEFTNTAAEPVLILEGKGSCGCTAVKYPTEAVKSGATAAITAQFKSSKTGVFNKTIKIKTSASDSYTTLAFSGEVVE